MVMSSKTTKIFFLLFTSSVSSSASSMCLCIWRFGKNGRLDVLLWVVLLYHIWTCYQLSMNGGVSEYRTWTPQKLEWPIWSCIAASHLFKSEGSLTPWRQFLCSSFTHRPCCTGVVKIARCRKSQIVFFNANLYIAELGWAQLCVIRSDLIVTGGLPDKQK